jgi:sodium transport system permease protein
MATSSNDQGDAIQGPSLTADREGRINWHHVGVLYRRELRAALREKTIVIYSILMPIFLYPLLLWAAFTGLMFVQGQTEGFVSRVMVPEWPMEHPTLRRAFQRNDQIQLGAPKFPTGDWEKAIKEGKLDARVEFLPATNAGGLLAGNFQSRITFNQSKERSSTARERVRETIEDYREDWLHREASARGLPPAQWQVFTVSAHNVASRKEMGAFFMGLMLPLMFVVMVAMGCFYPAIDATAGEHERNTWETLRSTAANQHSIVTAKYLYVSSLGGLAGILNLAAIILTLKPVFAPLLARAGETIEYTMPLAAVPVLVVAAVLITGFVAAGMMIFAAFARTFKEGQAMITPFYLAILIPVMFLAVPGLKLSLPLALLPIVNVAMVVREALAGTFPWTLIGVATVVSVALIAGCIRLAASILKYEDVAMGSYNGGFLKFLKDRVVRRSPSPTRSPEISR